MFFAPNTLFRDVPLFQYIKVNPKMSPGVILANGSTSPMLGVVFDSVVIENPPTDGAWGTDYYSCEGVLGGVATGSTWPVPPCFDDQTDKK